MEAPRGPQDRTGEVAVQAGLPPVGLLAAALGLARGCSVFSPRPANANADPRPALAACDVEDDGPASGWRGWPAQLAVEDELSETGSWRL